MKSAILRHNSSFFDMLDQNERGNNISECLTCGICVSRCTWYDGEGGPNPRRLVRMAQLGLDDLLAQSPMIWDCMVCNHCTVACPMGITMGDIVRKARSLPIAEELIPEDHICFLVEGLIDSLEYSAFDIRYSGAGHPAYHPRIPLKLLMMGVLDRIRSSRRLARNARENVVYMYLSEKVTPDFRTISDFRKDNPEVVKEVFKHTINTIL